MKPTDFLPEKHSIGQAAINMHVDHEIQMAREECYHAATSAMELHRMLKHVSEEEGLQAWASEKITLANDYLRTVKEWLEYEIMTKLEQGVAEQNSVVANPEPQILEDNKPETKIPQQIHLSKNGKPIKDREGRLLTFHSRDAAQKAANKLMSKSWNKNSQIEVATSLEEFSSAGVSTSGSFAVGTMGGGKMRKRTETKLRELAPTPPAANTAPAGTTVKPSTAPMGATTAPAGAPVAKKPLSPQGVDALADLLGDIPKNQLSQIAQRAN